MNELMGKSVQPRKGLNFVDRLGLAGMRFKVWLEQVKSGHCTEQLHGMMRSAFTTRAMTGHMLHPCIISGRPTLVHATHLADSDPQFYAELQAFAASNGYALLADRRKNSVSVISDRRRSLVPVLVFSAGVGSTAVASDLSAPAEQTLALFEQQLISREVDSGSGLVLPQQSLSSADVLSNRDIQAELVAQELQSILLHHLTASSDDPAFLAEDLRDMANYFAHYPEAVRLLYSLKDAPWNMVYTENTFETVVRGNQIQVQGATVKFDTRAAAKLRGNKSCSEQRSACVASPSDALLHELLHVETALLHSDSFIEEGGMNSMLYPFEHERHVINLENALYASMSEVDGQLRPSRRSHTGKIVSSTCVTCIR